MKQAAPGDGRLIEVAVAAPVEGTFTYRVPSALAKLSVMRGQRVLVPFGGRRSSGVVISTEPAPPPEGVSVREVIEVLDLEPLLSEALLSLAVFAADYYLHPLGEVLRAMLPPGMALRGARFAQLTEAGAAAGATEASSDAAAPRLEALARLRASSSGRVRVGGRGGIAPSVATQLAGEGLLELREAWEGIRSAARRPVQARLRVELEAARVQLARAPAQRGVIEWLAARGTASREELTAAVPGAGPLLSKLEARGLVTLAPFDPASEQARGRPLGSGRIDPGRPETLGAEQRVAVDALSAALGTFSAHLLEGVTGSGKTEVYLRIIEVARAQGLGALVLVPEIALTPQLVGRFQARFGATVALLHSGLGDAERRASWFRLHRGEAQIAVGVRSAIFAPVPRLGVIVVDEEHDGSFKQEEGLRYHARDLAVVRARQADALLLLGSATPSLESLANVARGRYVRHPLSCRVARRPMPEVEVIDLRRERPSAPLDGGAASASGGGGVQGSAPLLTPTLARALEETLARKKQAILFLNRRGQAPALLCVACGETRSCPNCEVSLTLHRAPSRLLCHYCGHEDEVARACAACGGELRPAGAGTQALERELLSRLPRARVLRLDRDATRQRGRLAESLAAFAVGRFDVMVGTQMVAKGHDFPGVTLVGVVLADQGLWIPDLRAAERTVQLLSQVSGRAGRGEDPGRVILQSYRPEHPAIAAAVAGDYAGFAADELEARRAGRWPPWCRLLLLRLDGANPQRVEAAALDVARAAEVAALENPEADLEVLGPAPAPLSRLRGKTRQQVLIKAGSAAAVRWVGGYLEGLPMPRGVRLGLDVDPMAML